MLPNVFEDIVLRIYSKTDDIDTINEINEIFKKWCKENEYSKPIYGRFAE